MEKLDPESVLAIQGKVIFITRLLQTFEDEATKVKKQTIKIYFEVEQAFLRRENSRFWSQIKGFNYSAFIFAMLYLPDAYRLH